MTADRKNPGGTRETGVGAMHASPLPGLHNLKPYPAYKDSGVPWLGEVPTHWSLLPNRAMLRRRKILVGERYTDYKLLSLTKAGVIFRDVSTGRGKFSADMGTSQEVRCGDFVFCLFDVPETPRTVGLSPHEGMITGAYSVFECDDRMLARYLEAFYIAMDDRKLLSPLYSGLRNTIPTSRFLGVKTPVLPRAEQTAIVRFLDHADRRIQRYIRAKQKLITLLEEQRKNATQEAIQSPSTTRHRLEAVSDLVKRPINRVSDNRYTPIGLYNRGRGIFRKEPRSGNDLGDSDFFWVEEGDMVISGQFAWEGAVALASDAERGCVASHRYPILRGKPKVLDSGFLLAFFQTDWGQLLLDHHSRGAAGRNRPLNARTLLKEKISLPPLRSQLRIVEMLRREAHVRQQAENWSKLLTEYRTRLIADVVTGQLDVREAAAVLPEVDPLAAEDTLTTRSWVRASIRVPGR